MRQGAPLRVQPFPPALMESRQPMRKTTNIQDAGCRQSWRQSNIQRRPLASAGNHRRQAAMDAPMGSHFCQPGFTALKRHACGDTLVDHRLLFTRSRSHHHDHARRNAHRQRRRRRCAGFVRYAPNNNNQRITRLTLRAGFLQQSFDCQGITRSDRWYERNGKIRERQHLGAERGQPCASIVFGQPECPTARGSEPADQRRCTTAGFAFEGNDTAFALTNGCIDLRYRHRMRHEQRTSLSDAVHLRYQRAMRLMLEMWMLCHCRNCWRHDGGSLMGNHCVSWITIAMTHTLRHDTPT
jgi:hypothetical protein